MDPNATLARFRELMRQADEIERGIHEVESNGETPHYNRYERWDDTRAEAAEVMRGLDEWFSKGGFLPDEWLKGWLKGWQRPERKG
jgi:hypothetical protein